MSTPPAVTIRPAVAADARHIRDLVVPYAERRILLAKELVGYYESVQEFLVAVGPDGDVVGCGALHVMWRDLGEVRTLAVREDRARAGVGRALVSALLDRAEDLGLERVFCLTFETDFFARLGFVPLEGDAVDPEVFAQLLRSHDDGVAEFLDLAHVKQNTLGNTRMIASLADRRRAVG
ncbi:amino-acid N-acetyltransferase [Litorihabitans aurantiacus]|uniref:N-acetylglutamate synthase n=1 Tax=Litorihabitans aurantiacus TaxID=1930061 RepID=A0AA37XAR2_9MICO|nr:amino-acid N-acetyltransferase [Litorihabitans aurantiacus]GMA30314.1 N-acetylglutamate synthase [Litorihabitans aurantiacus]